MTKVVIVNALRTPIGKRGQSLAKVDSTMLAVDLIKESVRQSKIDPSEVDEVIFGNLMNFDKNNIARLAWLEAGFPIETPATQVNKRCASSLSALTYGAMMIMTGNAEVVLTGGIESYSQNPIMIKRPEQSYPMTLKPMKTTQSPISIGDIPLLETSERIAQMYNISREECDAFAVRSHKLAAQAVANGYFKDQIVPLVYADRKGNPVTVTEDDCIREDSSIEKLSKLRPVVSPTSVSTAGNSSPMNDGASVVMLMSEEKALSAGVEILAEVKEFASAGCDPNTMGMGPIFSTEKLLNKTGYNMDDFDLIEINEAFATQSIACLKHWGIYGTDKMAKVNVNGGAIAIGHPNAASGGILVARIIHELKRRELKRGLVTFCIGGGQGYSLIVENYKA